jgi:endonuclease G
MAHLTFYDEQFNEQLKSRKAASKILPTNGGLLKLARRVGHMAESGAGVTVVDLERYIGRNDMLRFNYLSRGSLAGAAVCRIYVPDVFGGGGAWGTGFLITPDLLITNHHVISDANAAGRSFAEFGYQADEGGIVQQGKRFRFLPEKTFLTSPEQELDMSIIAVAPVSDDGVSKLENYGFLRMNPGINKVEELEFVSIIQHPGGDEKYIAIRENKVVRIGDNDPAKNNKIWYESDTAPGSSGGAVFNDQWQVVALHHSSVVESRQNGQGTEVHLQNGKWVPANPDNQYEDEPSYIANEGIRVSKIIEYVKNYVNDEKNQAQNLSLLKVFLDDALGIKPITVTNIKESIAAAPTATISLEIARAPKKNVWPASHYTGRKGYNDNFLGINIPFPVVTEAALEYGPITPVDGTTDNLLRYTHFSVIHNTARKIAFVTGVNIDGKKWTNIKRGDDKWYYDGRIPIEAQLGDEMYSGEPSSLGSKGWFDRGHLVRRQDPDWGSMQEANLADEDTFHWTNCSPQYWEFNQGQQLWQGLENYILYNTDQENVKAIVFSGPIFDVNDEEHRGVQIPQYFFKVVGVTDSAGKLFGSAYVVSQQKWAQNIPFEVIPVGDFNHFQTTIAKVEEKTGLKFGDALRAADVFTGMPDRGLRSLADIKHPRRL